MRRNPAAALPRGAVAWTRCMDRPHGPAWIVRRFREHLVPSELQLRQRYVAFTPTKI